MITMEDQFHRLINELRDKAHTFSIKLEPIFKHNEWRWVNMEGDYIPTAENIAITFNVLLTQVSMEFRSRNENNPHICISTGRLQVRVTRYDSRLIGSLELVPVSDATTMVFE